MTLYRDAGVVLRTHKLGESDRIITLITQESGKVRAVAKGVRKTKSRFGSRLEPMSHVQVMLYRGRSLDIVNQVELVEVSNGIRGNLESITDGLAMCEIVDQLGHERAPSPHLYRMLVGALRQLNLGYSPLLLPAFQLRLLREEGVGPVVDHCVTCGTDDAVVAFDHASGGALCASHRRGYTLQAGMIEVLRSIVGGRLVDVLSRRVTTEVVNEISMLARSAMEHHIERRIRASAIFEAPRHDAEIA
jgi:DNA repair protein RecO (recombination protein O)